MQDPQRRQAEGDAGLHDASAVLLETERFFEELDNRTQALLLQSISGGQDSLADDDSEESSSDAEEDFDESEAGESEAEDTESEEGESDEADGVDAELAQKVAAELAALRAQRAKHAQHVDGLSPEQRRQWEAQFALRDSMLEEMLEEYGGPAAVASLPAQFSIDASLEEAPAPDDSPGFEQPEQHTGFADAVDLDVAGKSERSVTVVDAVA